MQSLSLKAIAFPLLRAVGKPICKRLCGKTDPADDMVRLATALRPSAILDIGAHVGAFATALAKRLPTVPIHAFEPTPSSACKLRAAAQKYPKISVHELAMSSRNGEQAFFLNSSEQTISLLDNSDANNRFFGAQTAHAARVTVQTITLDSWMEQHSPASPLFIKADIQGAELALVEGGQETLRNSTALFFSEAALANLYDGGGDLFKLHQALTTSLPFVLLDIYRTYRNSNGRAMWTDAMWIHKDFLPLIGE
jgi:FkbM family methyltransferase